MTSVQDARNGTVELGDDGTVTFTPDADFHGEASFTYTVSDGRGGFDTAGVTVHVAPVEDAPTLEQTVAFLGSLTSTPSSHAASASVSTSAVTSSPASRTTSALTPAAQTGQLH